VLARWSSRREVKLENRPPMRKKPATWMVMRETSTAVPHPRLRTSTAAA
jgi:hypothetical protein